MTGKATVETRNNKVEISGIAPFSTVADARSDPAGSPELAERTGGESYAAKEAAKVYSE